VGERSAVDEQSHPLHATDRETVDRLLAVEQPQDGDLVDAGRLLMRYSGFPGARDLQEDLARILRLWGLDRDGLHERTREIWAAGHRPGLAPLSDGVGSGFDTANQEGP
jgi:hypothetical protein